MEILLYIIALFAACWIPKCYNWIKFKNKYPILSAEPPANIMETGDVVYLGKHKYEYMGRNNTNGLWYVFMPEDSVTPCYIDQSDAARRMDAVYGRFGIKWKKIK